VALQFSLVPGVWQTENVELAAISLVSDRVVKVVGDEKKYFCLDIKGMMIAVLMYFQGALGMILMLGDEKPLTESPIS
jgi:hypothetical protein